MTANRVLSPSDHVGRLIGQLSRMQDSQGRAACVDELCERLQTFSSPTVWDSLPDDVLFDPRLDPVVPRVTRVVRLRHLADKADPSQRTSYISRIAALLTDLPTNRVSALLTHLSGPVRQQLLDEYP